MLGCQMVGPSGRAGGGVRCEGVEQSLGNQPLGLLGLTVCPGKGSGGPGFSLGSDFLLGDLGQVVWGWLRWRHPEQVLYPHELTKSSKQSCEEGTTILPILWMQKPRSSTKATLWVKAQHEGALTPPCIVRKDPRVPVGACQGVGSREPA